MHFLIVKLRVFCNISRQTGTTLGLLTQVDIGNVARTTKFVLFVFYSVFLHLTREKRSVELVLQVTFPMFDETTIGSHEYLSTGEKGIQNVASLNASFSDTHDIRLNNHTFLLSDHLALFGRFKRDTGNTSILRDDLIFERSLNYLECAINCSFFFALRLTTLFFGSPVRVSRAWGILIYVTKNITR